MADPLIAPRTKAKLAEFVIMIKSFTAQLHKLPAYDMAEHIAKTSGLLRELEADKTVEGISRIENIEELLNGIREFSEAEEPEIDELANPEPDAEKPKTRFLDDYMLDIALLTDADKDDGDTNKVKLMTIHSAKGLEFPHVFISGMEENLFPSFMSVNSRTDLEEERRLFYVAVTRAMHSVTLSYAENRYRWGQLTTSEPSRFLDEIDPQFVEMPPVNKRHLAQQKSAFQEKKTFTPSKPGTPAQAQKPDNLGKNFKKIIQEKEDVAPTFSGTADYDGIDAGMKVEHNIFGKGEVIAVEGSGPNKKATVLFSIGQKQLLLKFAKLRIL